MPADHPAFPMFGIASPERRAATLGESGYKRQPYDFYPTPPWVTRALLDAVDFHLPKDEGPWWDTVWEPACGDGKMASVLAEAGYKVFASELQTTLGYGAMGRDFLDPATPTITSAAIITNPTIRVGAQVHPSGAAPDQEDAGPRRYLAEARV